VNERAKTAMSAGGVAAGLALAGAVLSAGESRYPWPEPTERVLYIRSGRVAERVTLSFDSLAADLYWIRAIQHYGRDRQSRRATGRFELLYPLLDLATTLDPYFSVVYRSGAVLLASQPPDGPGRVDQAIALLEKGLARSPNQWKYATDIGFIYYWYGTGPPAAVSDSLTAARWFERAGAMPGAPSWLRPLAAVTRAQGGDRAGARRLLAELATAEEPWIRRAAERGLQQLQALDDVDALQSLADKYTVEHRAYPRSWRDLLPAARAGEAPLDPAGVPYEFDGTTNRVIVSLRSPLRPLPPALTRQ
jgi:hypothetical protein